MKIPEPSAWYRKWNLHDQSHAWSGVGLKEEELPDGGGLGQ